MKQYEHVKKVHVYFDTFTETSLKFQEREQSGQVDIQFHITGAEQTPISNRLKSSLQIASSFKDELCKFLKDEWQKTDYQIYIGNKTLFVSYGGSCVKITRTISFPPEMQGSPPVADTLVTFHAAMCEGNLGVRATDTDVQWARKVLSLRKR